MRPVRNEYREWLTYEFTEREPAKATVALEWEELKVPFTVTVDDVNKLWVDGFRKDLRQWSGFSWQSWQQAAAFCAQNKINLPEALHWAERAVSDPYIGGEENFATLMTLSRLQGLNGLDADAAKSFDRAIHHPTANPLALHGAARQLMAGGKKDQAIRVFQWNAKRFPNQWPVHVGLMRAYAAMGDRKKALEEAKLALANAPNAPNRQNLQSLVQQLEAGRDIN